MTHSWDLGWEVGASLYPNWDTKGWLLPGDSKGALTITSKDIWKAGKRIQEDYRIWNNVCVLFSRFSTEDIHYHQNQKRGEKWVKYIKRLKRSDLNRWIRGRTECRAFWKVMVPRLCWCPRAEMSPQARGSYTQIFTMVSEQVMERSQNGPGETGTCCSKLGL